MPDTRDRLMVTHILESAGLAVSPVPECDEKRCDLRAKSGCESYLVEVKGLYDDEAILKVTAKGELYRRTSNTAQSPAVTSKIDEAVIQLKRTGNDDRSAFRLVALIDRGQVEHGTAIDEVVSTIYGVRSVNEVFPPARSFRVLWYGHSSFFKHRERLDGAIVLQGHQSAMFVNDYSARSRALLDSTLARFFASFNSLHSAELIERLHNYLIADCNVDRSNEFEVRSYVRVKYGLGPLSLMTTSRLMNAVSIPTSALSGE